MPTEFVIFGVMLAGIAILHRHALWVASAGLAAISACRVLGGGLDSGPGLAGLVHHVAGESITLVNLVGLMLGFALLARHFESSRVPAWLSHRLPRGWKGAFGLLLIVFALSAFLDNIAAALIGGTIANSAFRSKLHVGYLAGIVAAANAGGAGSVIGDTTTTMMWLAGIGPGALLPAYGASAVAVLVCGIPASRLQVRLSPLAVPDLAVVRIDAGSAGVVVGLLAALLGTQLFVTLCVPSAAGAFPFAAASLWIALLLLAGLRRPDWNVLPAALNGALFLAVLVLCASMMPVDRLPSPSWRSALGLGLVSAVFDNIPLTALALEQGGYDWGLLAYAVGFGGSMTWFGSSAGVALANRFPQAQSARAWAVGGWTLVPAYLLGFAALQFARG
jgi:Na+/H+ antiporter NhaD/arsenite permease-like protein